MTNNRWNLIQGAIDATALQVRRAYESHCGKRIPQDIPFSEIARKLIVSLGFKDAKALIEGQSNDPEAPEPPIEEG